MSVDWPARPVTAPALRRETSRPQGSRDRRDNPDKTPRSSVFASAPTARVRYRSRSSPHAPTWGIEIQSDSYIYSSVARARPQIAFPGPNHGPVSHSAQHARCGEHEAREERAHAAHQQQIAQHPGHTTPPSSPELQRNATFWRKVGCKRQDQSSARHCDFAATLNV
jgi:hypothetical protein